MKPKIKNIVSYFNLQYPFVVAEEWDKVGLVLGLSKTPVTTIIVALDLTNDVFHSAITNKASLIITHHPFLFNETVEQDIRESPYKQTILQDLQKTNIGVLTLHTNYDKTHKRTASRIAMHLGLKPITASSTYGHLFLKHITHHQLEKLLIKTFGLKIKDTNIAKDQVYKKWGLLPGAGQPEDIIALHNQGAEFIIVSDVKWSTWQTAFNDHMKIVEVSHAIEDVFTWDIAQQITAKWKHIKVIKKNILKLS